MVLSFVQNLKKFGWETSMCLSIIFEQIAVNDIKVGKFILRKLSLPKNRGELILHINANLHWIDILLSSTFVMTE